MLESEALAATERVVGAGLGGDFPVAVESEHFRPLSRKAAAARCIGGTARVFQVRIAGWGTAFEARTTCTQVVVDLRQARDDLAQSVLDQTESMTRRQQRQRARAAAVGIARPLSAEQFSDPARLTIDIACARALHAQCGSDEAVLDWLTAGLRALSASWMTTMSATAVRVHGLHLALPFLLGPFEPTDHQGPLAERPQWLDQRIRVLASDERIVRDLATGDCDTLRGTPLEGRLVQQDETWPPECLKHLVVKLRENARPYDSVARHLREPASEVRFAVERQAIGVSEAFG